MPVYNSLPVMRQLSTGLFCALVVFLFWASAGHASPFHHHEHEKKVPALKSHKADHSCPLKHNQQGLPCPHAQSKKNKGSEGYQIAPDCGGSPLASIPASVDFSKNLFSVSDSSLTLTNAEADGFILKTSRHKFSLSFQLDHPPKSL